MKTEQKVTILAAAAALLTLVVGVLADQSDREHGELLTEQIGLTGDYIDLILSERLDPVVPRDPELTLIKEEEVIASAEGRIAGLLERMKRRDRSILALTLSLLLFQLLIIFVEVSRGRARWPLVWLIRILLAGGVLLALAAPLVWIWG